jgi:2-phospho-L-lactate/phosphoenolpyruvate guanylyltransferase
MTTWVVIPVKQPEDAKIRLAGVLSEAQRAQLADAMLRHVVGAVQAAAHVGHVAMLGPSRLGLADDIPLLSDPGLGLNPALQAARDQIAGHNPGRLIVLFADLPQLTALDVQLLAAAPPGTIAIAPDRHGTGTNALSLPLPHAKGFTFAFGPDSFARHRAEAERLGIALEEVHSPGLARDVDMPEDLPDAAGLINM